MKEKKKIDILITHSECLEIENRCLKEINNSLNRRIESLQELILEISEDNDKCI